MVSLKRFGYLLQEWRNLSVSHLFIEEAIIAHPDVLDAAVYRDHALVVTKAISATTTAPLEEELLSLIHDKSKLKQGMREIHRGTETSDKTSPLPRFTFMFVDSIPRNARDKIDRIEVRRALEGIATFTRGP